MKAFMILLSLVALSFTSFITTGSRILSNVENPESCRNLLSSCMETVRNRDFNFFHNNKYQVQIHCLYLDRSTPEGAFCRGKDQYARTFYGCINTVIKRVGGVSKAIARLQFYEKRCNELIADDLGEANRHLKYSSGGMF